MTNTIAPPTLEELDERIVSLEVGERDFGKHPIDVRTDEIELYCLYAVRDEHLNPTITYYSHNGTSLNILWDGRKTVTTYHRIFIRRVRPSDIQQ